MIGSPARIASAPVSFGVDEVLVDDAWMPAADEVLDLIVQIGYAGTELGPFGYLGDGRAVRERLSRRGLDLVGAFLPLHFSEVDRIREDLAWLTATLVSLREATPENSTPFAVLADDITDPVRLRLAGRIPRHPEAWLPADRFQTLLANLHRAAEACREAGFEPVFHPHAGTYVETDDEIRRVADRLEPALIGLCLDTGHARFGGADPPTLVADYHQLIRHVHVKDCRAAVIDEVDAQGGDLTDMLRRGLFPELGRGDARLRETIAALLEHGYEGWLVVEQDRWLGAADTMETLRAAQLRNLETLRSYLPERRA
jgi:inosose dehydratase